MAEKIFPTLPQVKYGGPDSDNPLEWAVYNPARIVGEKTMKDHLRFAIPAWHVVCQELRDPFGGPTAEYPWDGETRPATRQEMKIRGLFEMAQKLGVDFYCFHGRDLFSPNDSDYRAHAVAYRTQMKMLKKLQNEYGMQLGWGTENLFSPKMYADGAFNHRNPKIAARAMADVKTMMEVTAFLGGLNYVFWGGRIGYKNIGVNDMTMEKNVIGHAYAALNDHRRKAHPGLQPLEEPKGAEPTALQYSRDAETTLNFLRAWSLFDDFKLNIEGNHALLAGTTLAHEVEAARLAGNKIGGIDANSGYANVGWDVDRFPEPHDFLDMVLAWRQVDLQGGLRRAVINFDAKPERTAWDMQQKLAGIVNGMDLWAAALLTVEQMKADESPRSFERLRAAAYADYGSTELGRALREGTDLETVLGYVRESPLTANDIVSSNYQGIMTALTRKVMPRFKP